MNTIVRKVKSAINLLRSDNGSIQKIMTKADENLRQLSLQSKNQKVFTYSTSLNFNFLCIPSSTTSVNLFVRNRSYEEVELRIAKAWLNSGDSCLDLGANIGYFSALLANQVSTSGKVIAVEPAPQTAALLKTAIEVLKLPQITLEQTCITNQENSTIEFMVSIKNDGSDVQQSLVVSSKLENKFKAELVLANTLDNLIQKHDVSGKVSLVKIDIEGAEPFALQHGKSIFNSESLPLFIVEVYTSGLDRLGFSPKDIYKFFPQDLFELYWVNRAYPNPSTEFKYGHIYKLISPKHHHWMCHTNLIAVPKTGEFSNRISRIRKYLDQ